MSLAGYFAKRGSELRMPAGKDSLGIVYEGKVLAGRTTVSDALRQGAVNEEMDPVLRAHCRVEEQNRKGR